MLFAWYQPLHVIQVHSVQLLFACWATRLGLGETCLLKRQGVLDGTVIPPDCVGSI